MVPTNTGDPQTHNHQIQAPNVLNPSTVDSDDALHPEVDFDINAPDVIIGVAGDNSDTPPHRGPLLISLTAYRLLNMGVVIAFGTAKAVLTTQGRSATPEALDWMLGVLFTVGLYWIGLWEAVRPPVHIWFFHTDYTRHILFFFRRFVTSSCVLFLRGILVPISSLFITLLPIWLIFDPLAADLTTATMLWRLFGVIAIWITVNFISLVFNNDWQLIWIMELILHLARRMVPEPGPLLRSVGRRLNELIVVKVRKAILPSADSNTLDADLPPSLQVIADMTALVSVIGLVVSAWNRIRQRWNFGNIEYASGLTMVLFLMMMEFAPHQNESGTWVFSSPL